MTQNFISYSNFKEQELLLESELNFYDSFVRSVLG
jgi:hypothetical protein